MNVFRAKAQAHDQIWNGRVRMTMRSSQSQGVGAADETRADGDQAGLHVAV